VRELEREATCAERARSRRERASRRAVELLSRSRAWAADRERVRLLELQKVSYSFDLAAQYSRWRLRDIKPSLESARAHVDVHAQTRARESRAHLCTSLAISPNRSSWSLLLKSTTVTSRRSLYRSSFSSHSVPSRLPPMPVLTRTLRRCTTAPLLAWPVRGLRSAESGCAWAPKTDTCRTSWPARPTACGEA